MARVTLNQLNERYNDLGWFFRKEEYSNGYVALLDWQIIFTAKRVSDLASLMVSGNYLINMPSSVTRCELTCELPVNEQEEVEEVEEVEEFASQESIESEVVQIPHQQAANTLGSVLNRVGDTLVSFGNYLADHQADYIELAESVLDCIELAGDGSREFLTPFVTLLVLLSQDIKGLFETWLECYNTPELVQVPYLDQYGQCERSWCEVRYDVAYDVMSWIDSFYIPIRYRLAFWLTR